MSAPACPPPRDPLRPKILPPPGACDTHAHVFGPASRFPLCRRPQLHAARRAARESSRCSTPSVFRAACWCRAAPMAATTARCSMRSTASRAAARRRRGRRRRIAGRARRWHALGVRGLRFNHFFRGGALRYRGGVPLDAAKVLAPTMAELGWHVQLWIERQGSGRHVAAPQGIGRPMVVDHMGRTDTVNGAQRRLPEPLVCLGDGGCSVRSPAPTASASARRICRRAAVPRSACAREPGAPRLGQRLAASAYGERVPTRHLLELFHESVPDAGTRRRILVDNTARLTICRAELFLTSS